MSSKATSNHVVFHEPKHFKDSWTYCSWVKLFNADVYALEKRDGFEATNARFWGNHPIRWISLVGIVVSITIKSTYAEIEIDDASGKCMTLDVKGTAAESINMDYEHNTCVLDITSLVSVRGQVTTSYRDELRFNVEHIRVLRKPFEEIEAWADRIKVRRELDVPWTLDIDKSELDENETSPKSASSLANKIDRANKRAKLREESYSTKPFQLSQMAESQHTSRGLKAVLLQHFREQRTQDILVSHLQAIPVLAEAARLVAVRTMKLKSNASRSEVDVKALVVSSSMIYRILNHCLAELAKDGSILSINVDRGHYAVIGIWNLGVEIQAIVAKKLDADPLRGEVKIKELWKALQAESPAFQGVSKEMVGQIMAELRGR